MDVDLYVGTAGTSVWFSRDRGESWIRPYSESGLYLESRVWALSAHPARPGTVLAGTDQGIHRWDPVRSHWDHLPSPLDALDIWELVQSPGDPDVWLAGTQPAALWRTEDGGRSWRPLDIPFAKACIYVHVPRLTRIVFDPKDPNLVYAGVEIDGVWRSADGGRSFEKCRSEGLVSEDIHGLAVVHGPQGRTLFATTNKGFSASRDDGESWTTKPLQSPWQYTRTVVPRADGDGTLFLTNGDGPPGSTGRLWRSPDFGESWQDAGLPGRLNSTPWCLATNRADPNLIFVCSNLGQIFRSEDGGERWVKLDREFGEVRSILWQPQGTR